VHSDCSEAIQTLSRLGVRENLARLSQPQYRLRVGDTRVFYDVTETEVQVLAIVTKAEAKAWLDAEGTPTPEGPQGGGAGGSEG
jgi:hypothetical protein